MIFSFLFSLFIEMLFVHCACKNSCYNKSKIRHSWIYLSFGKIGGKMLLSVVKLLKVVFSLNCLVNINLFNWCKVLNLGLPNAGLSGSIRSAHWDTYLIRDLQTIAWRKSYRFQKHPRKRELYMFEVKIPEINILINFSGPSEFFISYISYITIWKCMCLFDSFEFVLCANMHARIPGITES